MGNKKELENLRELVKECIEEQEKIGLHPANNIEVYFGQDPITKHRPNSTSDAISVFRSDGTIAIVFKKNIYDIYDIQKKRELIHHELIHLNLINGKPIRHKYDWKEFSIRCQMVFNAYGIDPSVVYSKDCFHDKNNFKYNRYTVCPRCGRKTYNYISKDSKFFYTWKTTNCGNCGAEVEVKTI